MSLTTLNRLCNGLQKIRLDKLSFIQNRTRMNPAPRYRPPKWFVQKERVASEDMLTLENKEFINEVIQDKFKMQPVVTSPLIGSPLEANVTWDPRTRRVGVIARKIGNYPLWLKNGKKVQTTLLQVVDNHTVKFIPPDEFKPMRTTKLNWREKRTLGCQLVGAESIDPSTVTKEYCGLFNDTGMMPKRILGRFMISPHAALPPGTPLLATHFRVGDYIDIRAKTIDRGFQGVMKRWGFKGMPASHGVTKTHRRPGNIGSGGQKARVWPGQKLPGHMGNRHRIIRGIKILRINTKYNVIWALGVGIPGETGASCYLFDSLLPLRRNTTAPPFPTQVPTDDTPLEYILDTVHHFEDPTITYQEN